MAVLDILCFREKVFVIKMKMKGLEDNYCLGSELYRVMGKKKTNSILLVLLAFLSRVQKDEKRFDHSRLFTVEFHCCQIHNTLLLGP